MQQAVLAIDATARALWPAARVALFGSQATGLALPGSDMDIVVLGVGPTLALAGSGFTQVQRKQLSEHLEDLLDALLQVGGRGSCCQAGDPPALLGERLAEPWWGRRWPALACPPYTRPRRPASCPLPAAQAAQGQGSDHRGQGAHHQVQAGRRCAAVVWCGGVALRAQARRAQGRSRAHRSTSLLRRGGVQPPVSLPLPSHRLARRAPTPAPAGGGPAADISLGVENGAQAVEFVRRQVLAVPPLRPLCLAIKAFLRCDRLAAGGARL